MTVDLEMGSTSVFRCPSKKCRSHWWARRFEAGDVRAQLLGDYEDGYIVEALMALFGLPAIVDRPMYWQVWLTGDQYYTFNKDRASGRYARTLGMFKRILGPLRHHA